MLSAMSVSTLESSKVTQRTGPFRRVGENLYGLKKHGHILRPLQKGRQANPKVAQDNGVRKYQLPAAIKRGAWCTGGAY